MWDRNQIARLILLLSVLAMMVAGFWTGVQYDMASYDRYVACSRNASVTRLQWLLADRPADALNIHFLPVTESPARNSC